MSILPPGLFPNLQYYLSAPLPCPYLGSRLERKMFARLNDDDPGSNVEINSLLCRAVFRRSQNIVYRPACDACNACVPIRIPVQAFMPSRSLKRVAAHNRDLHSECVPACATLELFELFQAYQKGRHGDGDMSRMDETEFSAMLTEGQADTHLYCLRDVDGVLKACMIADRVGDGLSAVTSFFTPAEPHRSLGTALILLLIDAAQELRLPFVYLGYWIAEARKMSYKSRFRPLQVLGANGWEWLEAPTSADSP